MTGIYVSWLVDAARLTGYPVVELSGWRSRGHGGMSAVEGVVLHHTGGPKTGEYPSLAVVRDGRSDLAGPLANFGLGRSGTVYVNAAGLAYHAGASTWSGRDPGGKAFNFTDLNSRFLGIEAESAGGGDWTDEQRDCYPRLVAALLHYMCRGEARACAHRECATPAGRKPDPTGIDMAQLRATVAGYLLDPEHRIPRGATSSGDDDMTPEESARLARLEQGMTVLVQQMCGEKATLANPWPGPENGGGWPTERYNAAQERLTAVMYLQKIDRQLNSALDLGGRPGADQDNAWGQVLSMRAEVRALAAKLDAFRTAVATTPAGDTQLAAIAHSIDDLTRRVLALEARV